MINKVILVGRLGKDPEGRHTNSGMAVCNFSVATDSKRGGESATEWHEVVAWDKQAQFCTQYLSKGRLVYVEGRLQTRSWEDQNTGQKRYKTEVVAFTVQGLDKPPERPQGQRTEPPRGNTFDDDAIPF